MKNKFGDSELLFCNVLDVDLGFLSWSEVGVWSFYLSVNFLYKIESNGEKGFNES